MTTAPADREFRVLPRGDVRDRVILANFRAGLRQLTNPDTGLPFAEEEIARATQPKTRFFIEADSIDNYGQGEQRRAIWLADQVRIDRASTSWLEGYHAKLWGKDKLPASGGGGLVTVKGTPGTLVLGSTTVPDPAAYTARSTTGKIFQVFIGGTIPASGSVTVTMVCRDVGSDTNLLSTPTPSVLTWITRDPGMEVQSVVASDFKGGTDTETDADQAKRIQAAIRYKEGSGNDSQLRAWARAASNAIEDAFVYPCALHSGTVLVATTLKRGASTGPLARLPDVPTQSAVIVQLTPPGSPVMPTPPAVLVTPITSQPVDIQLSVTLRKGSASGWVDLVPFPSFNATAPVVVLAPDSTHFRFQAQSNATLPGLGALATATAPAAPHIMYWDATDAQFVTLDVQSIQDLGSNIFLVTLNTPATVTVGTWIVPACGKKDVLASTVNAYMDARGPGEVVATTDERAARCQRFPATSEEWPVGVGADLAVQVISDLGGSSSDAQLLSGATAAPTIPTIVPNGPAMLTLGRVGIYSP